MSAARFELRPGGGLQVGDDAVANMTLKLLVWRQASRPRREDGHMSRRGLPDMSFLEMLNVVGKI
jgi:hypothetical protein